MTIARVTRNFSPLDQIPLTASELAMTAQEQMTLRG